MSLEECLALMDTGADVSHTAAAHLSGDASQHGSDYMSVDSQPPAHHAEGAVMSLPPLAGSLAPPLLLGGTQPPTHAVSDGIAYHTPFPPPDTLQPDALPLPLQTPAVAATHVRRRRNLKMLPPDVFLGSYGVLAERFMTQLLLYFAGREEEFPPGDDSARLAYALSLMRGGSAETWATSL